VTLDSEPHLRLRANSVKQSRQNRYESRFGGFWRLALMTRFARLATRHNPILSHLREPPQCGPIHSLSPARNAPSILSHPQEPPQRPDGPDPGPRFGVSADPAAGQRDWQTAPRDSESANPGVKKPARSRERREAPSPPPPCPLPPAHRALRLLTGRRDGHGGT
jgi:hypothetical protein